LGYPQLVRSSKHIADAGRSQSEKPFMRPSCFRRPALTESVNVRVVAVPRAITVQCSASFIGHAAHHIGPSKIEV
jgi:hypothetical protein